MNERNRAKGLLLISAAIWGSSFIVGRVAVTFIEPLTFSFLQNIIGSVVLLIALLWYERDEKFKSKLEGFAKPTVILIGVCNGLAYAMQYIALTLTTAGKTSLLVNLGIAFVPLFSMTIFKESIRRNEIFALILGLIGAFLITTEGDISLILSGALIGDYLALGAGLMWALWIVIADQELKKTEHAIRIAAPNAVITSLLLLISVVLFESMTGLASPSIEVWSAALYLGIFSIAIAYILYYAGLKTLGGTVSVVYLLLQTVVALVLGIILLSEPISTMLLVGAMFIMMSLVITKD
ncbi:MAG: EamA family transporter [Candidatus Lokiarchaeota archaeon]|nr:EamA family transporter [Candidatus Lokiarchaeota archaeon]